MRKFLKFLVISIGIILIIYGFYFVMGRPAIPLPAYRYSAVQGTALYDLVKATESGKVIIKGISNGEVEALADNQKLANITFTSQSLNYAVSLAGKYFIPAETQSKFEKINKICPLFRKIPKAIEDFFYHVIRFRFTIEIAAI